MEFISNSYGQSLVPSVSTQKHVYNSNGTFYATFSSSYTPAIHFRTGYTTNRRRPLVDSSTPWIPPSSYARRQGTVDLYGSGSYKTGGSRIVKDSPLNPTDMVNAYNSGDIFQRNTMYSLLNSSDYSKSNPDVQNAERRAQTKALLDLAGSKAGMGENLAQAVKTADLFLDTGSKLIRIAIATKNGNLFKAIRQLNVKKLKKAVRSGELPKSAADQWLAFWYGWKPLASDAYGIYELLVEHLKPALLVHGRGSGRAPFRNSWESGAVGSLGPGFQFTEQSLIQARCNLTGRVSSTDYLRTINRVGLLNPVGLAWDLVPFSFVVDWVYPIGDVAHGLSATAGLTFVGGHKTLRHQRNVDVGVGSLYRMGDNGPTARYKAFGFERTKLGSFPRPVTYYRSPFMGGSRIATVLALITKLGL